MAVPENEVHYLEIITPDAEAARDFYGQLHGWSFEGPAPELGNAFVAELPGGSLCGIRAPMHEAEKPTVRTYVRVADIQSAVDHAVRLGATLILGAMELPGRGTIAVYVHGGVEQGLWQLP